MQEFPSPPGVGDKIRGGVSRREFRLVSGTLAMKQSEMRPSQMRAQSCAPIWYMGRINWKVTDSAGAHSEK